MVTSTVLGTEGCGIFTGGFIAVGVIGGVAIVGVDTAEFAVDVTGIGFKTDGEA